MESVKNVRFALGTLLENHYRMFVKNPCAFSNVFWPFNEGNFRELEKHNFILNYVWAILCCCVTGV